MWGVGAVCQFSGVIAKRVTHFKRVARFAVDRVSNCRFSTLTSARVTSAMSAQIVDLSKLQPGVPTMFLYPGTGGQDHPSVFEKLMHVSPAYQSTVDHCCRFIQGEMGLDISSVFQKSVMNIPDEYLNSMAVHFTRYITSLSLMRSLLEAGLDITDQTVHVGHSQGELVAGTLSGMITNNTALSILCARAKYLKTRGRMIAVNLSQGHPFIKILCDDYLTVALTNMPDTICFSYSFGLVSYFG